MFRRPSRLTHRWRMSSRSGWPTTTSPASCRASLTSGGVRAIDSRTGSSSGLPGHASSSMRRSRRSCRIGCSAGARSREHRSRTAASCGSSLQTTAGHACTSAWPTTRSRVAGTRRRHGVRRRSQEQSRRGSRPAENADRERPRSKRRRAAGCRFGDDPVMRATGCPHREAPRE
jgi:hypothetical protein